MKHGVLRAIGHNIADSVAAGMGFMIGLYQMDVFAEARRMPGGFIEVDFLTGTMSGGVLSESLSSALTRYVKEGFPRLCESHSASPSDFRELKVRFWGIGPTDRFEVTLQDQSGRRSTAEYEGHPARLIKRVDHLGRIRS